MATTSILNRFAVLTEFASDGGDATLRFLPLVFDPTAEKPVLIVKISGSDEVTVSSLSSVKEVIEDVEVGDGVVSIWVEAVSEPIVIPGEARWEFHEYETRDYADAYLRQQSALSAAYDETRKLRVIIHDAVGFIDRTLDRSERIVAAKAELSEDRRRQIEALESVRRKLTER